MEPIVEISSPAAVPKEHQDREGGERCWITGGQGVCLGSGTGAGEDWGGESGEKCCTSELKNQSLSEKNGNGVANQKADDCPDPPSYPPVGCGSTYRAGGTGTPRKYPASDVPPPEPRVVCAQGVHSSITLV